MIVLTLNLAHTEQEDTNKETRQLLMYDGKEYHLLLVANLAPDYLFTQDEIDGYFVHNNVKVISNEEARKLAYPSSEKQWEMWFDDKRDGTNKLYDTIEQVKTDIPKTLEAG
jgi:hypothetical protein